ncbi:hypothetical protein EAO75_07990 [Streptomyces sp. uw30]|uniref:hypothetical protein n=1 Tax=Streptomyces sp. uw30 TaxID=1828179 RepID=UPI0011CD84F3|nr:hypothetical protein [Streptomyces sp. uw30]TXS52615.1 hypothetical protein EAO75_07990 [Streptomyces sp. uw30]
MTPHHAIEVTLTRPATAAELHRARRAVPLSVNAERTRLMAMQRAKSPGRALRRVRRQLDALLPVDILTTHYPDHRGQVRLNVAFSQAALTAIGRAAATRGQRPQDFLSQSVTAAVARHEQERAQGLTSQLGQMLAHHTAEEVLACTASALLGHHVPPGQ